jgi:outer membrane protein W
MKKILFWGLAMAMVASVSFAKDEASAASSTVVSSSSASTGDNASGSWLIQLEGGINIPASSEASTLLTMGGGGEGQIGYAFSKDFSLSVESGYETFSNNSTNLNLGSGKSINVNHIPVELVGQYNFAGGSVVPYIVVGAGVAFDSLSASGFTLPASQTTSWTNFELDPGIGVAFNVAKSVNVFVQGKVDMDFETVSGSNQQSSNPKGEFNDSPLLMIPVQVGVNFLL